MSVFSKRQPRDADLAWMRDRKALSAALADPAAQLAKSEDPGETLQCRLALWHLGAWVGPLSSFSHDEEKQANAEELITLAAIRAEAGALTAAQQLVERAMALDPRAFDRHRFAGLSAGLCALAPDRFARFAAEAAATREFRERYGTFRRLVAENANSICVVGNAPSEAGLRRGAFIDSHRLVIRFNNYAPDPVHWPDYGRKTDVWVRSGQYRDVWRRPDESFAHIVVNDALYWRATNGQDVIVDAALYGQSIEDTPRRLVSDLTTRIGALPSTGLVLLAWLRQILGALHGVSILGFAMSDQKDGLRHYYADRRTSKVQHAWLAEREIFDELVAIDGNRDQAPTKTEGDK